MDACDAAVCSRLLYVGDAAAPPAGSWFLVIQTEQASVHPLPSLLECISSNVEVGMRQQPRDSHPQVTDRVPAAPHTPHTTQYSSSLPGHH